MGLLSRVILRSGQDPDDAKLTYHGSPGRRDILKHGGQAGRWKVAIRQEGRVPGMEEESRGPRRGR